MKVSSCYSRFQSWLQQEQGRDLRSPAIGKDGMLRFSVPLCRSAQETLQHMYRTRDRNACTITSLPCGNSNRVMLSDRRGKRRTADRAPQVPRESVFVVKPRRSYTANDYCTRMGCSDSRLLSCRVTPVHPRIHINTCTRNRLEMKKLNFCSWLYRLRSRNTNP